MARKSSNPVVSDEVKEAAPEVASTTPAEPAPETPKTDVQEHTAVVDGEPITFGFITH